MKGDSASQAEQRVVSICGIGPVDSNPGAGAVQDAEQQLPRKVLGSKSMMVHPDAMPISWYSCYPICAGNLWQPSCLTFSACVKSVNFWALQLSKVLWLVTDFLTEKRPKDNENFIIPDDFVADKTRIFMIFMIFQYLPISAFSRCLPESATRHPNHGTFFRVNNRFCQCRVAPLWRIF